LDFKNQGKNPPKQDSLVFLETTVHRVGEKAEIQRKTREKSKVAENHVFFGWISAPTKRTVHSPSRQLITVPEPPPQEYVDSLLAVPPHPTTRPRSYAQLVAAPPASLFQAKFVYIRGGSTVSSQQPSTWVLTVATTISQWRLEARQRWSPLTA
jgi:hypothetical protein